MNTLIWTNQLYQSKFNKANWDQFRFEKSIWYTQGQQIKLVKKILAMFFNTRYTWLDQADQIGLLRLSWSSQLEQISGSNNDEQIKLVKLIW